MSELISKQAAIDAVMDEFKRIPTNAIRAKIRIAALPPAQPEPCEDAVSRKAVQYLLAYFVNKDKYDDACDGLKHLPSVTPKQRTGRWERHYSRPNVYADLFWHCSECGYKNNDDYAPTYHKFCPNCGIKMIQTDKTCDCYSDGRCVGTKEIDLCSCGGNKSKCDFYENVRREGGAE